MTNTAAVKRLSIKAQTMTAISEIAGVVTMPQLFHVLGAISGLGTSCQA